jgi:hypothetical protein
LVLVAHLLQLEQATWDQIVFFQLLLQRVAVVVAVVIQTHQTVAAVAVLVIMSLILAQAQQTKVLQVATMLLAIMRRLQVVVAHLL